MDPDFPELVPAGFTLLPKCLGSRPPADSVRSAVDSMILSASGWRKVFAASGDEEDASPDLKPEDIMLAGIIALSFADFLAPRAAKQPGETGICIARDSRPTGALLADACVRVFGSLGFSLRFIHITAAPEAMAYTRLDEHSDAFAYVSASHNPIGHNGFKFGLKTGGVLDGEAVRELTGIFLAHLENESSHIRVFDLLTRFSHAEHEKVLSSLALYKDAGLAAYRDFSYRVLLDSRDAGIQQEMLSRIRRGLERYPLGIVGDLNGSARTLSIDRSFLEGFGARVLLFNDRPGEIAHRIVPEGRSLEPCAKKLESAHREDPAFILGYVPDNDGDRGNLVYVDETGRSRILEAQQVFALVALAESAWLEYTGTLKNAKAAIAVNGPTSMRIDEICESFGMKCYRAEVGEANVVGLAHGLREAGWQVRLMGEGSNGGNITHPAAVRDPLNTLGSILKLMVLRDEQDREGLFHIWCRRRGIGYKPDFTLGDVLNSLPVYISTSAYEDRALMKIKSQDQAALKAFWEEEFLTDWEMRREELGSRWGIHGWKEINTEGGEEKIGFGPAFRSGRQSGGLKILLSDDMGRAQAYLWMRGSGTEPVFRVLCDVKGDRPDLEAYLLDWHRSMISRADARVSASYAPGQPED